MTGSLRFVSVLQLSEEAGIQSLGSDPAALWKVRFVSASISGVVSIVLAENVATFEKLFSPNDQLVEKVSSPKATASIM